MMQEPSDESEVEPDALIELIDAGTARSSHTPPPPPAIRKPTTSEIRPTADLSGAPSSPATPASAKVEATSEPKTLSAPALPSAPAGGFASPESRPPAPPSFSSHPPSRLGSLPLA